MIVTQDLKLSIEDLVPEVKHSIIKALREDNAKLHQRVKNLESSIFVLESDLNKQDRYNRCNNLDIQGIPDSVSDDKLEKKLLKVFNKLMSILIQMTFRTAIGWVNQTKIQSSVLSIGRIAMQFWEKKLI